MSNNDDSQDALSPDDDLESYWALHQVPPREPRNRPATPPLQPPWAPPREWLRALPAWFATLERRPLNPELQEEAVQLLGCPSQPPLQELLLPNLPDLTSAGFVFGSPLANIFTVRSNVRNIRRTLTLAGIRAFDGLLPAGTPVVLAYLARWRAGQTPDSRHVIRFSVGFALPDTGRPEEWFSYLDGRHLVSYRLPDLSHIDDVILYASEPLPESDL